MKIFQALQQYAYLQSSLRLIVEKMMYVVLIIQEIAQSFAWTE